MGRLTGLIIGIGAIIFVLWRMGILDMMGWGFTKKKDEQFPESSKESTNNEEN